MLLSSWWICDIFSLLETTLSRLVTRVWASATFTVEENVLFHCFFIIIIISIIFFVNYKFSFGKVERLEHDRQPTSTRKSFQSFTMKTTQKHANSLREKYNFFFIKYNGICFHRMNNFGDQRTVKLSFSFPLSSSPPVYCLSLRLPQTALMNLKTRFDSTRDFLDMNVSFFEGKISYFHVICVFC